MSDHPSLAFQVNERVLCFHGPLIYEAKVLQAEHWNGEDNEDGQLGPHFFVHYKGWKATWDEWVPDTRVLKLNDENKARQKQLVESKDIKSRVAEPSSKDGSTSKRKPAAGADNAGRPTKRGRESAPTSATLPAAVETEPEWIKRPEIKLTVPEVLKIQLVDDWEAVTKNNQLVPLPRLPNVQTVLEDYQTQYKPAINKVSQDLMREVCAGLMLYFTKSLGSNLLYRFERGQYGQQKGKDISQIYGAEHLLRLFVNLPELLAHTTMDTDSLAVLREALQDILQWLATNQQTYFLTPLEAYENTSSAYQNLAKA